MSANLVSNYGWRGTAGVATHLHKSVLRTLRELDVKRVADLGAGNGALCRFLAERGYDVVGIEYDKEGVAVSKEQNSTIPFYCLGVQDDPAALLAAEQPFEAVVSTEVIEHLFSPELLPKFADRLLSAGGHLVITTPYHGYLKNLAIALSGKWDKHFTALRSGGHIKFFSVSTITRLLEANGFRVVKFEGVGRAPYLWKSMLIVAQRK